MADQEFKRHLVALQEAIDEAAEGQLSGALHLRLCAEAKALHDLWAEQLPKRVRQANVERLASLIREAEMEAHAVEVKMAALRPPKSAKTPLMCFKDRHIPEFATKNPDESVEEVLRLLHDAYEQLSEEGKAPYRAAADADLARYTQALKRYQEAHEEALRERQRAHDLLAVFRRELRNEW
jgi:hypothetical protein